MIAFDDGTFDGVKPTAFTQPHPNSKTEYVLGSDADELTIARRAWGLSGADPS